MIFDRDYFEKTFETADPWGYERFEYERVKHQRQLEALRQFCPQAGHVLEIGCAEGLFTAALARDFPSAAILGIDISSSAIERAKNSCGGCPAIRLEAGDVIDLLGRGQLPPAHFDVVIQSESLYYMFPRLFLQRGLGGYLRGIARTLKPGGIFVTANGVNPVTRRVLGVYYRTLQKLCRPEYATEHREWNGLRNQYSTYEVRVFRKDGT